MEQIAEFTADPAAGANIYEGAARLYEVDRRRPNRETTLLV
jgi:hypothetical protein